MKLGFVSAILDGWTFEETIDTARELGFECVEMACWPQGKSERRYAGVSHIDVTNRSEEYCQYILNYCKERSVEISSLAFYPNTLDPVNGPAAVTHLYHLIDMSALLGVNMITTFIGRVQTKTVDENIKLAKTVWTPILTYAKEKGVKVAIENCPMLFDDGQWPGGQNIFTTPANWEKVFEALPFDNLGINYDPSHFIWQMIDYIKPIYKFKDRIFHVHCKDIKLYRAKLNEVGIMGYPLQFMSPKLPGLGDVDWGKYISALTDVGYNGSVCIEVEDRAFESTKERVLDSLRLSSRYLKNFVQ